MKRSFLFVSTIAFGVLLFVFSLTSCSENFPRQKKVPKRGKDARGKLVYHLEPYFYGERVGMDRDGNLILYRKLLP